MNHFKAYKEVEQPSMIACEPTMEYGVSMVNSDAYLPDDILVGAAEYASMARGKGRMIPHGEVYDRLAKRMGWK